MNLKQKELVNNLQIGNKSEIITNPFSGVKVELEPLAVALYDLIKGCEIIGNFKTFDQARYIFMEKYPKAYMQLLD